MINISLIKFLILALTLTAVLSASGQGTKHPFVIRDSNKGIIYIDHFTVKCDSKTYEFSGDTTSVDYKSLSRIDPSCIKGIEILRNSQLEGQQKTVVIVTLKKSKIRKLPNDIRNRLE